jgi:signal peptidase II
MQKLTHSNLKWNIVFLLVALLVIGLDQWSKNWLQTHLVPGQSIPEAGFFRLTYAQNTGAAFSIFYGRTAILTYVSILGALLILSYNFFLSRAFPTLVSRWNKVALGLILGGTVGNLIDRFTLHYVRDFIDVGPWPIFNVADSSVVVGVIMFAIAVLRTFRSENSEKSPQS